MDTLKKVDATIFSEFSLNTRMIHQMISSSDRFFWWSVTVNSWIPSAIHCIQSFHYSRNTKGYRTEVNLWETRAVLELSFIANTAVTFQSCDLESCHEQQGFHISPSHHGAHPELQIHVCFSSEFLAFTIIDWSPKSEWFVDQFFVWKRKPISSGSKSLFLYWFCLTFQLKANGRVWTSFMYLLAY